MGIYKCENVACEVIPLTSIMDRLGIPNVNRLVIFCKKKLDGSIPSKETNEGDVETTTIYGEITHIKRDKYMLNIGCCVALEVVVDIEVPIVIFFLCF